MKKNIGPICILLCAFIWGFCIVGQATGMEVMGPWSFSAVRLTVGGVSLIIVSLLIDLKKHGNTIAEYKQALKPGLICMPIILSTIMFQQYGLLYTGVGKCAFITAFYIFLVPLLSTFIGGKISKKIWICVVLAMAGLYLITMSSGFDEINKGDIISLGAALMYSVYIIVLGKTAGQSDVIKFSAVQFTACGLVSFIPAAILETGQITFDHIMYSIWPILLTGVISCALGYTLQIVGQKYTKPDTVSIVLSSETVFSLLSGMIFLHEVLTVKEYIGCAIMTIAIIISVMPERKGKRIDDREH